MPIRLTSESILFVTTLAIYSLHFHRMRLTGAPYTHNGRWTAPLNPIITPTGATMSDTLAHPLTTPVPGTSPAVGTREPPRIETISNLPVSPIGETFVTPVESLRERKEVEVGPSRLREIRHSGTFFIDDGIVSPTDSLGGGAAKAEPTR